MDSLSPEVLQLLSGAAGAFVGGLLLVWRIRARLPELVRSVVHVVTNALRALIADEMAAVMEAHLKQPMQRLEAVETNVQQLRRHVGLPSGEVRRTGT